MLSVAPTCSRQSLLLVGSLLALGAITSCEDNGKLSAKRASEDVAMLATVCEKDVAEIDRGLPEGAKRLGKLYAGGADPAKDLPLVHKELARTRRDVSDLMVAKSTFFALADSHGMGIRNDLDEDTMAGRSLAEAFPEIVKAASGVFVHTTGAFPGVVAKYGPDKDWVAATGVKRDDGSIGGLLVTGWSYRYFAKHLSETLKNRLITTAKAGGGNEDKLPIFYTAVFDDSGIYTAPLTPEVNEHALRDAGLLAHTANGAYQAAVTLTGREFGFAAVRVPALGLNTGIVVLRSEL